MQIFLLLFWRKLSPLAGQRRSRHSPCGTCACHTDKGRCLKLDNAFSAVFIYPFLHICHAIALHRHAVCDHHYGNWDFPRPQPFFISHFSYLLFLIIFKASARRVGGGLSTSVPSSNRSYGFPVYDFGVAPLQGVGSNNSSYQSPRQAVSLFNPSRNQRNVFLPHLLPPITYLNWATVSSSVTISLYIPIHVNVSVYCYANI